MTPAQLALVEAANLAPSVHNIQPGRFRFEGSDGAIALFEDRRRRLFVGDPSGADNLKSLGAAAEGLVLALSLQGVAGLVEMTPDDAEPFRRVARITPSGAAPPDLLAPSAATRASYRGVFAKPRDISALGSLAAACPDLHMVDAPDDISRISDLFDAVSMQVLRDEAYRRELVSWMRLNRSDPNYVRDGLSAAHMALSPFEAAGARVVMGDLFPFLDGAGLAAPLLSERAKVRSAAAIALFHRPANEPEFETGRRFYRVWLEVERLGLVLCPMSVLADVGEAASMLMRTYGVAANRKLVTVFRIGARPASYAQPPRARLPAHELILPAG